MNQSIKSVENDQFEYQGRWVKKKQFRAFVYDKKGNQQLAKSYEDFESMIASGIWFENKPAPSMERKQKHVVQPASQ